MIYRGKIFIEGDLACFINKKMSISAMRREKQSAKPSLRTSCSTPGCSSWMVPAI